MLRQALTALSQQPALKYVAIHHPLARAMARRFVAGETLEEAIEVVRQINSRGMAVTLDHLGENVTSRQEAQVATLEYCDTLRRISSAAVDSNVSLKLTQMGLDLGRDFAFDNVHSVVEEARKCRNFVRIDMENSSYVSATLEVFYRLFSQYDNVGVVVQACLYRTKEDVDSLIAAGARVRLVKGAYLEPPAVAYQNKADVDWNYVRLMELLLSRGNYPAIATHDEAIIEATKRFARAEGIGPDRFEFQMLYGIRRDLQSQLVQEGYRVRIYVPFGTEWYPYLVRRMAERPANLMFVLSNLAREAGPAR